MTIKIFRICSPCPKSSLPMIRPPFLILTLIAAAWSWGGQPSRAQEAPAPYKNPSLAVDARVADLIGRMTLEEKVRQLDMYFGCESLLETNQCVSRTHAKPEAVFNPQMAETNLGTLGVGSIHDLYPRARLYNRVQAWVIQSNRLGIPALFIEEGLHGYMDYGETVFPQASISPRLGIRNWRGGQALPSRPKPAPTAWT